MATHQKDLIERMSEAASKATPEWSLDLPEMPFNKGDLCAVDSEGHGFVVAGFNRVMDNYPSDSAFIEVCSPANVLKLLEAHKVAMEALQKVGIQVLSDEYEDECGDELGETEMAEAYEFIICDARKALTRVSEILSGGGE